MHHQKVKQQYITGLLLNRKIQQFILWRFVCYIPTVIKILILKVGS